jgi:ankyrin repeat protein
LSGPIQSSNFNAVKTVIEFLKSLPDDVRKSVLSQNLHAAVVSSGWNSSVPDKGTEILRLLLKAGADPNFIEPIGGKPIFHKAVLWGNAICVQHLLDYDADPLLVDADGRTALHSAYSSKIIQRLLRLIPRFNVNVNAVDQYGYTPLMEVVNYSDDPKSVKMLVEAGANFNARTKGGKTILMLAVEKGHCEIVEYLLTFKRLNINAWEKCRNALSYAMIKHHLEIARMLLKKGAIMTEFVIKNRCQFRF